MAISKNLKTIYAREDVDKTGLSCTVGENENWYNHYGSTIFEINHSKTRSDPPPRVMEMKTKIDK